MSTTTSNVALPPPVERYSALGWLKKNLFQNWLSSVVTVLALVVIIYAARGMLLWVFGEAQWQVIATNIRLLMVGQYPQAATWRVWACLALLGLLVGLSWSVMIRGRRNDTLLVLAAPFALALIAGDLSSRLYWLGVAAVTVMGWGLGQVFKQRLRGAIMAGWLLYLPVILVLIRGWEAEGSPLGVVTTNLWGGLLLTFLLAGVGMVLSFPLGVLLAIGRQSRFPVIRSFCVVYIELIRAVPLITVLFMAQTMLPLFLPESLTPDRVVRAMTAITLFSGAYMAENVRGGLQAMSKGQYEAAYALGLNGFQTLWLIILPQALRSIIPILTAHVIGGFRDTSLVLIVGLLDLLGIAKTVQAQPAFLGRHIEVYSFLAALYWGFSYLMSMIGQRIEATVGVRATGQ